MKTAPGDMSSGQHARQSPKMGRKGLSAEELEQATRPGQRGLGPDLL